MKIKKFNENINVKINKADWNKNSFGRYEDRVRNAFRNLKRLPKWVTPNDIGEAVVYTGEFEGSPYFPGIVYKTMVSNLKKSIDLSGLFDSWELNESTTRGLCRFFQIRVKGIKPGNLQSLRAPVIEALSNVVKASKVVIHRDEENNNEGFINVYVSEVNKNLLKGVTYDFKWKPSTDPNYKVYDFYVAFNTGDYDWDDFPETDSYAGSFDEFFDKFGKEIEDAEYYGGGDSIDKIRKEVKSTGWYDGDQVKVVCKQINPDAYEEVLRLY